MKRSPLKRGKGLKRKAALRSTSQRLAGSDEGPRGIRRTSQLARQKGLERAAPKFRRAPRRWTAAKLDRCEVCRRSKRALERAGLHLEQHHVFYEQHVETQGGDVWDPRDSLTVCAGPGSCHAEHHGRTCPIALVDLPDAVYEFARELLGGPAAYEYLARRYAQPDPRLDALLDEV